MMPAARLILAILALWGMPGAHAQPAEDAATPGEIEEIIITAPRRAAPDFQTFDEFQRAEFERLRQRYEQPSAPPPRADEVFALEDMRSPGDRSDVRRMMREGPRLRDLGR